ncbi:MAG: hypothetical protein CMK36_05310 [Porticoccaceae bacterium]|nr:hypothetical protein [Porticoccaceae bacterium]
MELTNYSFLQSRNEYMNAIANRKVAADRVATGKRMERSGADVGSVSQLSNYRAEMISDRQSIINLQNLRSFLFAQENSLKRVHEMYDKMEILALKAANPTTTEQERKDYEIEYSAYREQLDEIMKSRYNGKLLFSSTEMCGGSTDISLGALDASNDERKFHKGGVTIRAQTVETGSPSGKVSFRVNSGTAGDNYRIWMGDICVFSAGPAFKGSTNDLYEELPNGEFVGKNYNQNKIKDENGNGYKDTEEETNEGVSGPFSYKYDKTVVTGFDENNNALTKQQTISVDIDGAWSNRDFSGRGWRTSGGATNGDADLIEVEFAPGKETTYKITPGASNDDGNGYFTDPTDNNDKSVKENIWNGTKWLEPIAGDGISDYNQYDETTGKYVSETSTNGSDTDLDGGDDNKGTGVILTNDLPKTFDRTEMTLQIESTSIGLIYPKYETSDRNNPDPDATGVSFTPTPFVREIPKDRHGNNILLDPKGFDRFSENVLSTPATAQEVVDKMRGNGDFFGEMKCIVENRIGILGSEYKRVEEEIRSIEEQIMSGEVAMSRIRDADMAKEATALARENIKSELATQVMSNSSRLKDVLIPLTTSHFRGSATSSSLE